MRMRKINTTKFFSSERDAIYNKYITSYLLFPFIIQIC